MTNMEKRLNALLSREEATRKKLGAVDSTVAQAVAAMRDGTASIGQYAILLRPLVKQDLKRWAPTLTLGHARRHLGLAVGHRRAESWWCYVPGDVLAFSPAERLTRDLEAQLDELDGLLNCKSSDPDMRINAARARLTIGSAAGESRRGDLWSGRCEKLAHKRYCDSQKWLNSGLLGVWPELDRRAAEAFEQAGADPLAEDQHVVVPYAVFEHILWEMS